MRMRSLLAVLLTVVLAATGVAAQESQLSIDYEKYTLSNGLEVVLHQDDSDPITAVAVQYHVGSNREEVGRTGFAHLFEHMMFQSSQHVGQDQFFQKIQAAGGTLNGGTSSDATTYFEVVPKNALEMALWLESDRMGYLLPTVTYDAFVNQQNVVQNEKRQRVDNRPYGHTQYVIGKLLYPENHPYSWTVIGSFEDLANATLEDIRSFFTKWYGPNNATLVVAGDFDEERTRAWIDKYFGEIPSPEEQPDPEPWPVRLDETRRAFHEDNFARSPELRMTFPTVEQWNEDSYPLRFLGLLLADGKRAPLYKEIVEDRELAPEVSAFQRSQELAGVLTVRVRAFPGTSLTEVEDAVHTGLERFETEGFTEADLDRIKASVETGFYNGISSVLGKAFQLANYNEYAGSPDYVSTDLERLQSVTAEDVWRVYEEYVKGQHYVLTSFVPKGEVELVAEGSERFPIPEEDLSRAGVVAEGDVPEPEPPEMLPSSFDRSVEPAKGPVPELEVPEVWSHTYANGLRIFGIEHDELPLVQFSLTLNGGQLLDDADRVGVANLMTDIMMEGTRSRTPRELEEAIDSLGASIGMFTGRDAITIQANGLRSRLDGIYGLFEEILLEPRWDETELERLKRETVETINRRSVNPAAVASNVFNKLIYGDDHVFGQPTLGTPEAVASFGIEDVQAFYEANYSPNVSHIAVAGDIGRDEAIELFRPLEEKWAAKEVDFPSYAEPEMPEASAVYFVDVPQARQSEIRVGHPGPSAEDPDFYAATVMNYTLGGAFNSNLNMILREERGYTYGARSFFNGNGQAGTYVASSAVRSNVTLESARIFREEIESYAVSPDELDFAKSALIQANARRFETLGALRSMLNQIGSYDRPFDYVERREDVVRGMTLEDHRELVEELIHPDRMIYLVVGDGETQFSRLRELGLGEPILLDRNGDPVGDVMF